MNHKQKALEHIDKQLTACGCIVQVIQRINLHALQVIVLP